MTEEDDAIARDESASIVRQRLERMGIHAQLAGLPGWERVLVYEAVERAHRRDLADHTSLAGARYLQEMADVYRRARPAGDRLADVLEQCATAHVYR